MDAKKDPAGAAALILAGGESRRFGSNKALAPFGNGSLISNAASILRPYFTDIYISAQSHAEYSDLGLSVLPDIIQGAGPIAGIHAGLKAAASGFLFVTACDMPFISGELIEMLRNEAEKGCYPAIVAGHSGFIEPLPGFYSVSLIPEIEEITAREPCGLYSFLKGIDSEVIEFSEPQVFINVNRPSDLQNIRFTIR